MTPRSRQTCQAPTGSLSVSDSPSVRFLARPTSDDRTADRRTSAVNCPCCRLPQRRSYGGIATRRHSRTINRHCSRGVFRRSVTSATRAIAVSLRVNGSRTSSIRQTWQRYTCCSSGRSPVWRIWFWQAGHFHGIDGSFPRGNRYDHFGMKSRGEAGNASPSENAALALGRCALAFTILLMLLAIITKAFPTSHGQ